MRKFPFLLLAFLSSTPAHSENLNLKFGPNWSCRMISAELKELYDSCRDCERQGKHFNQTSATKGKCVDKLSLRGKYDVPPDIAKEREAQQQIEDQTKEKEAGVQERLRQQQRGRESGVSGSSRAPSSRNPQESAQPNSEIAKLDDEMRRLESDLKDPARARPHADPEDEFGPNVIVFALRNNHKYSVQASFYSQNRGHEWPGGGQAYVLNDSQVHKYRLNCRSGEKICFGAWVASSSNTYWGVGPNDKYSCQGCCGVCGSSSIHGHNLVYTGGGGGSSTSGINATDLLGAAIGIAGAVTGRGGGSGGGGSPSYRAAPHHSPGPPPRNRESGVSGGR